jgi:hypothetical protein
MKIETSSINMNAETNFTLEQTSTSSFTNYLFESKQNIKDEIHKQNKVEFEVAKLERVLLVDEDDLSHQDHLNKKILEMILEAFTDFKDIKLQPEGKNSDNLKHKMIQVEQSTYYHKKEYTQESSINFQTQAQVKTNKGQINIDLDISFSQKFTEKIEQTTTSTKINYLDPLIINYEGNLTSFDNINSQLSLQFDLNSNGKNEIIPQLKDGAGFLALDKNNNKTIDNGSELFGATSGDGFKELKEYDEDGNSWIDENDSIFNSLLIWDTNKKDEASLIALGQAGIGAIYLSAVDSTFRYTSGINQDYAKLKQSSFYLKENGQAGLVTSSDFVV